MARQYNLHLYSPLHTTRFGAYDKNKPPLLALSLWHAAGMCAGVCLPV